MINYFSCFIFSSIEWNWWFFFSYVIFANGKQTIIDHKNLFYSVSYSPTCMISYIPFNFCEKFIDHKNLFQKYEKNIINFTIFFIFHLSQEWPNASKDCLLISVNQRQITISWRDIMAFLNIVRVENERLTKKIKSYNIIIFWDNE